ncbi:MAG TPA: DUF2934 domain-containing protein [Acetobacteraceae bacterium]|nr:DUF2934 domain-containing protein [Acetobacteraceae bacterium]
MDHASSEQPSQREQQIRERAYALWEEEGRQPNRDAEYWHRATDLVGQQEEANPEPLPRDTAVQRLNDAETAAALQPAEKTAGNTSGQAKKARKAQTL